MLDFFETTWLDLWGEAASAEPVGAIFTKLEIVRLILDLASYDPTRFDLARVRVLEPSCGDGAFVAEVVRRLCISQVKRKAARPWADPSLDGLLRACDISEKSVEAAKQSVVGILREAGCSSVRARHLSELWIVHRDFLMETWDFSPDLVVGNPPYVRIEDLPRRVIERYRQTFDTVRDRADLYVAFLEKGLQLLSPDGTLAFICANRFTKNQYGRSLRQLIASRYRVRHYVNLEHTQPFEQDVSAYPAIIVVDRKVGQSTHAATLSDIGPKTLRQVRREAKASKTGQLVSVFPEWYADGTPWLTTNRLEHQWFESLAAQLPTLEQSAESLTVGIGCATGADAVFVLDDKSQEIEDSRQLPLLMAQDIGNDALDWSGHYLVNPFDDETGALVDLARYPGLGRYLKDHGSALKRRHVARGNPTSWYRTIDRIWPKLVGTQKLLLPDIQGETTIGLDSGKYYPHHNLYFISSPIWNMRALKCLLRSTFVRRQVSSISVQLRGGSLRFQAQTLRRIRLPAFATLPAGLVKRLDQAGDSHDQSAIDGLANDALRMVNKSLALHSA